MFSIKVGFTLILHGGLIIEIVTPELACIVSFIATFKCVQAVIDNSSHLCITIHALSAPVSLHHGHKGESKNRCVGGGSSELGGTRGARPSSIGFR